MCYSTETGVVDEGVGGKEMIQVSAPKGGLSQSVVVHIPYVTGKFSQCK